MRNLPKWATLDRNDILVMLLIFPAALLANYLILGERYFAERPVFIPATVVSVLLYFSFGVVMDFWMKFLRLQFPDIGQSTRRIVLSVSVYVLLTAVLVVLLYWIYERLSLVPDYAAFRWILVIGFASNVLAAGLHEAFYSHRRWQQSVVTEFRLHDVAQRQQLEVLKQQINPHFLFNSLNILDALIDEDSTQAHAFLDQLASVYRYLLRANEQSLAPLSTELDFVRSYFHLLKTRHGDGLNLTVKVEETLTDAQLPPLTLQLLVENAVKHNVVLPDQPLTIELFTADGCLTVRNNLQRKRTRVFSNGVGLSNILTQYQMLGQPAPIVTDDGGRFTVTLPLVAPV